MTRFDHSSYISRTFALRLGARFDLAADAPAPAPGTAPAVAAAPASPASDTAETPAAPSRVTEHLAAVRTALAASADRAPVDGAPEDGTDADDAPATRFDESVGRHRNADGTFARAEGDTDQADGASPAPDAEGDADTDDAEPAGTRVTLPARRDGEPELEIEVTDPAVAEHLNHLRNGYMRREEFSRRLDAVTQRETAQRAFEAELTADPIGIVVRAMRPEQHVEMLRALLPEYLEHVLPDVEGYVQDPMRRVTAFRENADARRVGADRARQAATAAAQAITYERQSDALLEAVHALVPPAAPADLTADFLAIAEQRLVRLIESGTVPSADTVPALLAPHVARFFGAAPTSAPTATPAVSTAPARPAIAVARPVSSPGADADPQAGRVRQAAAAARLPDAQARRAAARAVAPVGAGAPPVAREAPPEHQTVKDRLNWVRQKLAGR